MYGWIIIISYVHYKKKDWELAEVDVRLANSDPPQSSILKRKPSHGKSPFSRNSSLSQRGRRSFLLRHHPAKTESENVVPGVDTVDLMQSTDQLTECGETGYSLKDNESAVLLGESATMSLTRTPAGNRRDGTTMNSPSWATSETQPGVDRPNLSSLQRSPPRYKKRGGFVPEVLRKSSTAELASQPTRHAKRTLSESTMSGNTVNVSTFDAGITESEEASLIPSKDKVSHTKLKIFTSKVMRFI